jgi:hypothetical protein
VARVRIDSFGTVAIIATHDTELRLVPTMGSVVQMRLMRATLLAIVVAFALASGVGPAASARAATEAGPALMAESAPAGAATNDPCDPGFPPD